MASVSLGLWVRVGGRFEPAALSGISHFIEHLLFKGTRHRSARQISQDIEGIGGYLNAFTTEESTCFYSKACSHCFPELLDVLMDMFLNSTFDPVEIEKERCVIKEELAMYLDQPQQHVQELLNETLWPNHPLGRSLTGTEQTLNYLTRSHLLEFRRAKYVSGGTLLAVAGDLKHEKVVKAVSRFAPFFPEGRQPRFLPVAPRQESPRIRYVQKSTEQTQLAMGFRTCSRHDDRRFALRLLHTILGENMSSRLFQALREDHGLAYSISSSLSFFNDTGALTISAGLDPGNLMPALKLIIAELRKLTQTAPSAVELRRARDYVIGQIDLSLENTENQMMWVAEHWLGYRRILSAAEIKEQLYRVKPAEVKAVAQDFVRPERLSLALVSPEAPPKGLATLLKRLR